MSYLLKVLRYQLKAIITQPSLCLKYVWLWFGETFNIFRINKLCFKGREVYLRCTFVTLECKVTGEVLTSLLPSEFGDACKSFFTWLYMHTCMHTHTLCSHSVFRKWKELMSSVLFCGFLMLGFIWSFSERCVAIRLCKNSLCFNPTSSYVTVNPVMCVYLINHIQHCLSSETVDCQ